MSKSNRKIGTKYLWDAKSNHSSQEKGKNNIAKLVAQKKFNLSMNQITKRRRFDSNVNEKYSPVIYKSLVINNTVGDMSRFSNLPGGGTFQNLQKKMNSGGGIDNSAEKLFGTYLNKRRFTTKPKQDIVKTSANISSRFKKKTKRDYLQVKANLKAMKEKNSLLIHRISQAKNNLNNKDPITHFVSSNEASKLVSPNRSFLKLDHIDSRRQSEFENINLEGRKKHMDSMKVQPDHEKKKMDRSLKERFKSISINRADRDQGVEIS